MSTRSNIILKEMPNDIYLYHHCDGYPVECGVGTQLRLLAAAGMFSGWISRSANMLVKGRFDLWTEKIKIDNRLYASCNYEITNCIHDDIEFLYTISFDEFWKAVKIECEEIKCVESENEVSGKTEYYKEKNMVFTTLYKAESPIRELLIKGNTKEDIRPIDELLEMYGLTPKE